MAKFSFLTTQAWEPDIHHFGIAGIITGTILIALVAVVIAIPVSLGLSLYISEVAPARISRTLVSLVDLMAAVPSVVYGLWALYSSRAGPSGSRGGCPSGSGGSRSSTSTAPTPSNPAVRARVYSASTFIAGIAVSLMVIPILTLGDARVVLPGAARGAGGRLRPRAPPGGG